MEEDLQLGFDYGAGDAGAAVDEDLLNLDKYAVRKHGQGAPAATVEEQPARVR